MAAQRGASHDPGREALMTAAQQFQQRERRSILQDQLEIRFGKIPPHIIEQIQQAEFDQLRQWLKRLVVVENLDDVFADNGDNGKPSP